MEKPQPKQQCSWGMRSRSKIVSQPWPPDTDQNVIPASVCQFLNTLLTGECECQNPFEWAQRFATSFGSGFVFAVASGKTKPLYHVLLSYAVRYLTGNTELIRTLNRLGHCVSYSVVEEIDKALCTQKLECSKDDIHCQQTFTLVCSQPWPGITSTNLKIP
jgi:hypothetical protein